ncbi:hypothetical protein, variant [Spizellomyces punctatus DAOM BR117]|uniref:Homeobox domain-containing protein n=1 Tax=Spizellomyces punctatus (strain DAOM BR117) TaxID=645134 RepID=A0A0L0HGI4_SPIPD|nr:hypothetical protein, variant [Spizellomyces punctatus DAOM BR117]KND00208.1 hypothetical protein, variant [Spizellomyces punctatus DAOM BR117]|eukprot:XP_016608247.1 hypothetical protein, variant [Spizellomyces punctatus DAOM BR117]
MDENRVENRVHTGKEGQSVERGREPLSGRAPFSVVNGEANIGATECPQKSSSACSRASSPARAVSPHRSKRKLVFIQGYNKRVVRRRFRTTKEQLSILNEFFTHTEIPTRDEKRALAERLGMAERQVQVWFQNRRAAKKTSPRSLERSMSPATSPSLKPTSMSGVSPKMLVLDSPPRKPPRAVKPVPPPAPTHRTALSPINLDSPPRPSDPILVSSPTPKPSKPSAVILLDSPPRPPTSIVLDTPTKPTTVSELFSPSDLTTPDISHELTSDATSRESDWTFVDNTHKSLRPRKRKATTVDHTPRSKRRKDDTVISLLSSPLASPKEPTFELDQQDWTAIFDSFVRAEPSTDLPTDLPTESYTSHTEPPTESTTELPTESITESTTELSTEPPTEPLTEALDWSTLLTSPFPTDPPTDLDQLLTELDQTPTSPTLLQQALEMEMGSFVGGSFDFSDILGECDGFGGEPGEGAGDGGKRGLGASGGMEDLEDSLQGLFAFETF